MATIQSALQATLLKSLTPAFVSQFQLEEAQVRECLTSALQGQFKSGKSKTPRVDEQGNKVPGRVTGYIVFSNDTRQSVKDSNPELKFSEIGKQLGAMWSELSIDEKGQWNRRAEARNKANGIVTTPAAGSRKTAVPVAAAAAKSGAKSVAPAAKALVGKAAVATKVSKPVAPAAKSGASGVKTTVVRAPAAKPVSKAPVRKPVAVDSDEDDE